MMTVSVLNVSILGDVRGWIQSRRGLEGAARRAERGNKPELAKQLRALTTTPHGPFIIAAHGLNWHVIATP
jgi:hypothetical protein